MRWTDPRSQVAVGLALLAAVIAIPAAFWLVYVGLPEHPVSVAQMEAMARKGVPLGSNRAAVEAWMRSQGIEYGYHDEPEHESSVDDAGLEPELVGGIVQGIIRDTDRSPMIMGNISLYFFLDKEGRTIKHLVQWVGTGP